MSKQSKRHMGLEVQGDLVTSNSLMFRNRIINGDMRIDQREDGASATIGPSTSVDFRVDRFFFQRLGGTATFIGSQQSATAPVGFTHSLKAAVQTAATPADGNTSFIRHILEGFNISDLGFGTPSAKPITLSFWVRSSLVGTHGGSISNGNFSRSYVFTYTINSTDTWEYKTVTIPGDVSGTWASDNTAGMRVNFDLGSGSDFDGTANAWESEASLRTSECVKWISNSGATFYVTGVQLEAGSSASAFEHRPYGMELALCQRYYYETTNWVHLTCTMTTSNTYSAHHLNMTLPSTMRVAPTLRGYRSVSNGGVGTNYTAANVLANTGANYMATTHIYLEIFRNSLSGTQTSYIMLNGIQLDAEV